MNISFTHAIRMDSTSCVAFIGAGGKTTAMFNLARDIKSGVVVTATTHLGLWQSEYADKHIATDANVPREIEDGFQGVLLITGKPDGDRLKPVNNEMLYWLYHYCHKKSIPMLIEADGSHQKPSKAWAGHEPPIPEFVDIVVQVAGLTVLGKPLNDEFIHRPEIFSKLSGLKIGEEIGTDAIIQVLIHKEGGLKNIPDGARRIVLLNQSDTPELQSAAHKMTSALLSAYQSVIVASLTNKTIYAVHEPIAGIVLAAGESTRFGKPKQLLDWKGQPFVRAVVQTAIRAGLSPIIVVTGANADEIEATISDLNAKIVRNENWKSGQGSSIREGLRVLQSPPPFGHLPKIQNDISNFYEDHEFGFWGGREGVGGAIFLLADQPQVNTAIIQALKEKHSEGLQPIVAPMVMDRRGNPVLFDRVTFTDLTAIEGDTGGRSIFHKYRVAYLPWYDDSLLLDVDTPEQYQRLISNGGL